MRYIRNSSTDPHYNMAFDECCLEQLPCEDPVFYVWRNRPSVIIGLNQNAYGEVNIPYLDRNGITLARRVTGGGAVYHDLQNINYTIVGRSSDLERDYSGYLHYMLDALRSLGVDATLSGRNDIMVGGRKVSGYAKRVWRDRLMIHGTLMYDVDIDTLTEALATDGSKLEAKGIASVRSRVANLKELLPRFSDVTALMDEIEHLLASGDGEIRLPQEFLDQVTKLSEEKFSTWEWNYGHSKAADIRRSGKFACGTVGVAITLDCGRIESLRFSGDFLGNRPSEEISSRLKGIRFLREDISDALAGTEVSECFDAMSRDQLINLLMG